MPPINNLFHGNPSSESGKLFDTTSLSKTDNASFSIQYKLPMTTTDGSSGSSDSMDSDTSSSSSNKDDEEEEEDDVENSLKIDEDADHESLSDKDNDPIECATCDRDFPTLQAYMDHRCARESSNSTSVITQNYQSNTIVPGGCLSNGPLKSTNLSKRNEDFSDGESFDGKIVYNSDGSAYIIEGGDSDLSDLDSIIDLPHQDDIIIDKKGSDVHSRVPAFPYVANAFFVSRNPAVNSIYRARSAFPHTAQAPMMFSYRVYDVRSGKTTPSSLESDNKTIIKGASDVSHDKSHDKIATSGSESESSDSVSVPTKPILMCFICKLSFGYTKSFTAHANNEHAMTMNSEEVHIMSQKNSSAIIQCVGKEKQPLMSFLEPKPLKSNSLSDKKSSFLKHEPYNSASSSSLYSKENTSVSFVYSKPKLADSVLTSSPMTSSPLTPSSPMDMYKRSNSSSSQGKIDSRSDSLTSGLTGAGQGQGAKFDLLSHYSNKLPLVNTLPTKLNEPSGNSPGSPAETEKERSYYDNEMSQLSRNRRLSLDIRQTSSASFTVPSSPMTTTTTHNSVFLGMCDDHPQGRAQGVECPKCDMVLSSSQSLGGHMTMMHSRNSCKTLKCPKCNWHYKYQETLEIHMKEKHPENEQQCMYCMTNQSHPRLARGESYSCGYKPYRCDVCNYSTTTKGKLTFDLQSHYLLTKGKLTFVNL